MARGRGTWRGEIVSRQHATPRGVRPLQNLHELTQKSGQILYCPGVPCRPPVSVSNTDWAFGRSSVVRFDRSLQTRVSTRPAGKTAHECGDASNGGT